MPNEEEEIVEETEEGTTEPIEQEDEQPKENPNSLGNIAKEAATTEAKKQLFSVATKSLAAHPMVLVWIGIGILVLFVILIIVLIIMDFDYAGTSTKSQFYPFNCQNIYLVSENEEYLKENNLSKTTNASFVDLTNTERYSYIEYDLNTYISSIVWNDNKTANDVDNEIVYQAMAVATRSRIVSNLEDNCVVLRDYNSENFTDLTKTEEKYREIESAVENTNGLIIGKSSVILNAKYDAFSYTKKREEENSDNFSYHMMNTNEKGEQIIPASWVKKNNITPKKVNDSVKLESLSLYGAKYLTEQINTKYDLYRILTYYYGKDIEYYTIDEKNMDNFLEGCFWWPIGSNSTTLENGVLFAKEEPATIKITSSFGYRNQPIAGASSNHPAIDIGGGVNGQTNIIAVAEGKVTKTITNCVEGNKSCGGGLGNAVYIEHSSGVITRYGHMSIVSVKSGDSVKQGQVIGKMGNTGTSTGTHLDFQVQVNGAPVNPLSYVSASEPRKSDCYIGGEKYTGTSKQEFIDYIAPSAVKSMQSTHILASVTIAQAILESGWGTSSLASRYNNYFGMKAGSSWNGRTIVLPTKECDDAGRCYSTKATWRVYNNVLESINDHAKLLQNKRYNGVVGETSYYRAITIIKKGGYATDPDYVSKIVNMIRKYNLDQYDKL